MLFHGKKANNNTGGKKCNHDFADDNNTLQVIPKFKMTYPMKINFYCTKCNKIFTLEQDESQAQGVTMKINRKQ